MEKLKILKKELAESQQALTAMQEDAGRLERKRDELTVRLSEIGGALSNARATQDEAVTRFARDEITEDALDKGREQILSLEGRRSDIVSALKVVEGNHAAIGEKMKAAKDLLRRKEETAWDLIVTAELAKAAAPIRRAYAAMAKTGVFCRVDIFEFLRGRVYDAAFCNVSNDASSQAVNDLAREYLK